MVLSEVGPTLGGDGLNDGLGTGSALASCRDKATEAGLRVADHLQVVDAGLAEFVSIGFVHTPVVAM